MKEKFLFDDWGPVPEPPAPLRERLRTVVEALLIAACLVLGLLGLVVGSALYLTVLVVLICACPFAGAFCLVRNLIGPSSN